MIILLTGLAGCSASPSNDFAPRSRPGPPTSSDQVAQVERVGVDAEKFEDAWDALKEILVATAITTTLNELGWLVEDLRRELDAIDQGGLNEDEKRVWSAFDRVYWTYEDSLSLWAADIEAGDTPYDGIPLYRDGKPLFPRAEAVATLYGLVVTTVEGAGAEAYVPDNSVGKLWQLASNETEKSLLPVLK